MSLNTHSWVTVSVGEDLLPFQCWKGLQEEDSEVLWRWNLNAIKNTILTVCRLFCIWWV